MKSTHVRTVVAAAVMALACGCYTQLATVDRTPPPAEPEQPCPDSLQDSCEQAAAVSAARDTVVIRDDRHQVCYWSRNWWGEPVLRCYRTYYTDEWVSYYSDPWWYDRYGYSSYGYRSCPSAYYYDPYTGYCRYGRDYQTYYHHPGGYGSGSGSGYHGSGQGSGTSSRKPTPRPTVQPTPPPSSAPTPLPKEETTTGGLAPYYPGGSSRNAPATSVTPSQSTSTRQSPSVTTTPSSTPAPAPSVSPTKESAQKPRPPRESVAPTPVQPAPAVVPGGQGQGDGSGDAGAVKEPREDQPQGRKAKHTESQK